MIHQKKKSKKNLYLTFFFSSSSSSVCFRLPFFVWLAFIFSSSPCSFFPLTHPLVAFLFRLHLSELAPKSKHYTECQWQDNGLFVAALLNTVMLMLDPLRPSVLHRYIPANMCFRIVMCWFFTVEQKSRLHTLCIELFFFPPIAFFRSYGLHGNILSSSDCQPFEMAECCFFHRVIGSLPHQAAQMPHWLLIRIFCNFQMKSTWLMSSCQCFTLEMMQSEPVLRQQGTESE